KPQPLQPYPISYKDIPAELAWEMNLGLPKGILVLLCRHNHGFGIITNLLIHCFNFHYSYETYLGGSFKNSYLKFYRIAFENPYRNNMLVLFYNLGNQESDKFLALLQTRTIIAITRDPFSALKSGINHWDSVYGKNVIRTLNLTYETKNLFTVTYNGVKQSNGKNIVVSSKKPDLKYIDVVLPHYEASNTLHQFIQKNFSIYYLDVLELYPDKIIQTAHTLAKDFGWDLKKEALLRFTKQNFRGKFYPNLPRCLIVHPDDLKNPNTNNPQSFNKDGGIKIHIMDSPNANMSFFDVTKDLFPGDFEDFIQDDIKFLAENQNAIEELKGNSKLLEQTRIYLKEFVRDLQLTTAWQRENLISEYEEIAYIFYNVELRNLFKATIAQQWGHLKICRPDIIKSWKYYQEFLKICEEG
ncbi:MAG: DUF2972 domain-containing protein, partial [Helicobacter sp.]|nr:DUF2972 domain-containing protein [Helicobacter sp.]